MTPERWPDRCEVVRDYWRFMLFTGMRSLEAARLEVAQVDLRRGELLRIRWEDVDVARRLVLVRDRKDPRRKDGNDQWVPLVGDALEVIQRQPRGTRPEIFPFGTSISIRRTWRGKR